MKDFSIWRKNQITGLWVHQRKCQPGTEQAWLTIFKKAEPDGEFKLSRTKPSWKKSLK